MMKGDDHSSNTAASVSSDENRIVINHFGCSHSINVN